MQRPSAAPPSSQSTSPGATPPEVPGSARRSAGSGRGRRDRLTTWWTSVPVATVVAAILVVTRLGAKSLWRDEAASYVIAALPFREFLATITTTDFNSSLFYALLRPLVALGHSETLLRSIPAVAFVATVPVMGALGRRLLSPEAGRAAAWLAAGSVYLLGYGQEARTYALVVLASVLALLLLDRAVVDQHRWAWFLYGLVMGASLWMHLYSAFTVVAHAVALLWWRPRIQLRHLAAAVLPLACFWVPMAFLVVRHAENSAGTRFPAPLTQPIRTALDFAGSIPLFLLFGSLVGYALWTFLTDRGSHAVSRWRRLLLVSAMVVPVLVSWIGSHLVLPSYGSRYIIGAVPPMLLLTAEGLVRIRSMPLRRTAVAALGLASTVAIAGLLLAPWKHEDIRAAYRYVSETADPGDAILYLPAHARLGFRYYAVREPAPLPIDVLRIGDRQALWVDEVDVDAGIEAVGSHDDVWIVGYPGNEWHPSPPVTEQVLERCITSSYRRISSTEFGEMTVMYWQRIADAPRCGSS